MKLYEWLKALVYMGNLIVIDTNDKDITIKAGVLEILLEDKYADLRNRDFDCCIISKKDGVVICLK